MFPAALLSFAEGLMSALEPWWAVEERKHRLQMVRAA